MNNSAESVVRGFFEAMGREGNLIAAVEASCADNCRWENTGLPTAADKAAMLAMMKSFIDDYQLDHMEIELVAIATAGDTVVTERIDHLKRADGSMILSIALAGALQVKAGKVVRWTDYFDPRPLLPG